MTDAFKQECAVAIAAFDKSFKEMNLPQQRSAHAQALIDKFKEETANEGLNGVAFALDVRYFFNFFNRELLPGGIVLSSEASQDWDRIRQLANSPTLLATTQQFVFNRKTKTD